MSGCHSNGDRRVIRGLASLEGSLSGHQAAERKLPSRGNINLLSSLLTLRLELSSMSTPHMLPVGCCWKELRPPSVRKAKCFRNSIACERQKHTILDSRLVGRPAAVEKLTCAARATNRRPAGNGIQDEVGPKAEHAQRIRVDRPGSRVWAERNTAPSARNVNHIPAALSHEKAMLREVTAPARGDMRPATTPFAGGNALEAGRPGH